MGTCIVNLKKELKKTLVNIKLLNYKDKLKRKAYNPLILADEVNRVFSSGSHEKFSSDLLNNTFSFDLFSLTSMSSLKRNLEYTFTNKLDTDLLFDKNDKDITYKLKVDDKESIYALPSVYKRGITISSLLSSIPEYINKAKKAYGANYKDEIVNSEGKIKFNANGLAYIIGREIHNKAGIVLSGEQRDITYKNVGMSILKDLENKGLITLTEKDSIPVFNMINIKDNTRFSSGRGTDKTSTHIEGTSVTFNSIGSEKLDKLLAGESIKYNNKKINSLYEYHNELKKELAGNPEASVNKDLNTVNQLILATNLGSIFTPMNTAIIYNKLEDIPEHIRKNLEIENSSMSLFNFDKNKEQLTNTDIADAVKEMESKPYYIRKEYLDILKLMAKEWRDFTTNVLQGKEPIDEPNTNYTSFSIQAFLNYRPIYKNIFKISLADENGIYNTTSEDKESNIGKTKTRTYALFNILNELDKSMKNDLDLHKTGSFYKMFFRGANARIYNALIALNEEGDKVISRNIIQRSLKPNEFNAFSKEGKLSYNANAYITSMVEQLPKEIQGLFTKNVISKLLNKPKEEKDSIAIHLEKILREEKVSSETRNTFMELFAEFNSYYNVDDKQKLNFLKKYHSKYPHTNITHTLNAFMMLQDLLNSPQGKINSTFDIESDASASGINISVFNEYGSNNIEAKTMLEKLSLVGDNIDKEPEVKGFYEAILDTINSFSKESNNNNENLTTAEIIEQQGEIKESIEDSFNSFKNSERNPNGKEKLKVAKELWNLFTDKLHINQRNLVKPPTMTVGAYKQSIYNAAKGDTVDILVDSLLSNILDKNNKITDNGIDTIQEILKKVIPTLSENEISTLNKYLPKEVKDIKSDEIVGTLLDKLLDEKTPKETIKKIYNTMFNSEGKARSFISTLLVPNLATLLAETAHHVLQQKIFAKDTSELNSIFKKVDALFGINKPKIKTNLKIMQMVDPGLVVALLNKEEINSNNLISKIDEVIDNIFTKYPSKANLKLLQKKEGIDPETQITQAVMLPNFPTLEVSSIHAIDTAILGKAFKDFKKYIIDTEGEEQWNSFNISTIHDALSSPAKYQDKIKEIYTKAEYDILSKIDRSLLYYKSTLYQLNKIDDNNLNETQKLELNSLKEELNTYIKSRENTLLNRYKSLFNIDITKIKDRLMGSDITEEFNDIKEEINKLDWENITEEPKELEVKLTTTDFKTSLEEENFRNNLLSKTSKQDINEINKHLSIKQGLHDKDNGTKALRVIYNNNGKEMFLGYIHKKDLAQSERSTDKAYRNKIERLVFNTDGSLKSNVKIEYLGNNKFKLITEPIDNNNNNIDIIKEFSKFIKTKNKFKTKFLKGFKGMSLEAKLNNFFTEYNNNNFVLTDETQQVLNYYNKFIDSNTNKDELLKEIEEGCKL
jgi:hypothetical protein